MTFTSLVKANKAAINLYKSGAVVAMYRERSFRTSGYVYFVEVIKEDS